MAKAAEDEFHDWYDTEHLPERQRVPGILSARRFRATSGPRKYVALYHLAAPEVPSLRSGRVERGCWPDRILTKGEEP